MKKININYTHEDVEELTKIVNKKYSNKSTVRKMRKHREDKQAYEKTFIKRNI